MKAHKNLTNQQTNDHPQTVEETVGLFRQDGWKSLTFIFEIESFGR